MSVRIQVVNLSKKMKANQALSEISTDFEPSRLHGVIGPDGAGKTTLIRCLVGLLAADHGTVYYYEDGKKITFQTIRPRIAYMPQQQSLYADLTVSEHLDFFRDLYLIPKDVYAKRRAMLLQMTRMKSFQDRQAGKLSGGMYKKLGLMCALLQSPDVVLLDEPTNGVDPISRREFWELLYQLIDKGILVIVSTAYMDEAERCSRVHVLDAGKLLASGEPRIILNEEDVASFEALFVKRDSGDSSFLQKVEKKKSIKKDAQKKVITKVTPKKSTKKKAKVKPRLKATTDKTVQMKKTVTTKSTAMKKKTEKKSIKRTVKKANRKKAK